ncbi:MAG: aminoacyl-tRNA hydrolase [Christensenellales bacterium]
MKLIVGLGNPTPKYRNTYHNLGFMTVDKIADILGMKFSKEECKSKVAFKSVNGEDIVIAKPQTFMNLSGEAVKELMRKYGAYPEDLMVIYDDVDIPVGKLRLRLEGSSGTHNGMRNIVSEIHTEKFNRLRVGFKDKDVENKTVNMIDKVLSPVAYNDKEKINGAIDKAAKAVSCWIDGKATLNMLMQELNR